MVKAKHRVWHLNLFTLSAHGEDLAFSRVFGGGKQPPTHCTDGTAAQAST